MFYMRQGSRFIKLAKWLGKAKKITQIILMLVGKRGKIIRRKKRYQNEERRVEKWCTPIEFTVFC